MAPKRLQTVSQNTLILLANQVIVSLLGIGLTILIGRGLGDVGLGRYATIMAWVFPLTVFTDFGINTLIVRDIAESPVKTASYFLTAFRLRLILGLASIVAITLLAPYLTDDVEIVDGLRIGAWLIFIDAFFGTYTALWRAEQNMAPIAWLNLFLLVTQGIGVAIAITQDQNLLIVIAVLVLADAAQLILAAFWWHSYHPFPKIHSPLPITVLLKAAATFALGGVLGVIQLRMMILLVENLASAQQTGWFAAANRFVEMARLPIFALFGAIFPAMATVDTQVAKTILRWSSLGLMVYGAFVAILLTLTGESLLILLLGESFAQAAPILAILSWGLVISLLRQNMVIFYYANHRESGVNLVLAVGVFCQLILGFLWIEPFGGVGAAWAWLIVEGVMLVLLAGEFFYRNKRA